MVEALREFCIRYHVHFDEEPGLMRNSRNAWLVRDVTGKHWVLKGRSADDTSGELLRSLTYLHGPFITPHPVSEPDDPFVLYPHIEGKPLSQGLFEAPGMAERIDETAGRVQAMMRSLTLVPFYEEMLRIKEPGRDKALPFVDRFSAEKLEMTNAGNKSARRMEIAKSFHWLNGKLPSLCDSIEAEGLWPGVAWDSYREKIKNTFSIHVPMVGSNLAHCAFHPEHVLLCADDRIAVVGWHVEPRPRFYMKYTFWAWSLLHSDQPDPSGFYGELLGKERTGAFRKERCQVLSFCILERFMEALKHRRAEGQRLSDARVALAGELFQECVAGMA